MRYSIIAFSALIVLAASFGIHANVAFACDPNSYDCDAGYFCNTTTNTCEVLSNPSPGGNPANPSPGGNPSGVRLVNPLGEGTTLNSFLLNILSIVTDTIGPVIVILMLVYVGFLFVTAQGNSTKISAAREMLLWTVVGALILLGAKAIAIGICETVKALSTNGNAASCF